MDGEGEAADGRGGQAGQGEVQGYLAREEAQTETRKLRK